jgi:hypothetical protein
MPHPVFYDSSGYYFSLVKKKLVTTLITVTPKKKYGWFL